MIYDSRNIRRKCPLPRVLILINKSQLSKLAGYQNFNMSRTEHDFSMK